MKQDQGLKRLIELARRGRTEQPAEAPFGFATRVAAGALPARGEHPLVLWERMARWSLAVAVAACVATAAFHRARPAPQFSALANFAGLNSSAESLW